MSDEMGAAVVNELQKRGRRVPEDVSVLGFDNTSTALHVHPPLSTMAQPLEEMGRMAVKKLLRSRDLGPKIMPHQLIERGSTAPTRIRSNSQHPNPAHPPNPTPRQQPALTRAAVVVLPLRPKTGAQNQVPHNRQNPLKEQHMRQRRRTWQTLLTTTALVTAAAVSLTACGGSAQEPKAAANAAAAFEGKGPINYVSSRDASGAAQKSIDEWNAAHPDQKVTFIELPDSADQQRQQLIQNAQIKSDTFSVLNLDVVWNSEFAANKWVLPLPADAIPTADMIPATVNAAKYRDTLYGAPYYTDGALFYYRTDLLKAAGVAAPPKTWDEMKAACDKVLALPEAKGMSCYAGQFDKNEGLTVNFSEAVASAGGSIVDAEGKPTVNTAEARQGLSQLVDGFKDGLFPSATPSPTSRNRAAARSRTAKWCSCATGRSSTRR